MNELSSSHNFVDKWELGVVRDGTASHGSPIILQAQIHSVLDLLDNGL